jgi:hypothetical protein
MTTARSFTPSSRRAFTIVPIALGLWIVLIVLGLLLWNKTPPPGYVPSRTIGPGQVTSILGALIIGAFWNAVLSRVAERKGMVIANVTACFIFGLACLGFALTLAGLTKDQRDLTKLAAQAPAAKSPRPVPVPNNAPAVRPGTAAEPASVPTSPPSESAPTAPAPHAAPKPPPAPTAQTTPAIDKQPIIASVQSPLESSIAEVIAQADKLLPDLAKPPAHDLVRIRKRLEDVESLRAAAAALGTRVSSAGDDLTTQLQTAGINSSDARFAAARWLSADFHAAVRGFGCDALVRLCDKAKDEAEFARDNLGKWTLDSKGEFKATDRQIKTKLDSNRFFVKADADRKQQIFDQLRGK